MCGTIQLAKNRANYIKFLSLLKSTELITPNTTCVEKHRLHYRPSTAVALTSTEKAFICCVVWTSFLPNPQGTTLDEMILKNSLVLNQNFNTAPAVLLYSTAARPSIYTKSIKPPQDSPVIRMWYTDSLIQDTLSRGWTVVLSFLLRALLTAKATCECSPSSRKALGTTFSVIVPYEHWNCLSAIFIISQITISKHSTVRTL